MRHAERQGRPIHTHRSPRSGLAFILVLTVILGLAAIATPFVLSMIMLERTAVVDRARRQAGYGAEGVRNFAVARLYRTAEHFQRQDLDEGKNAATPYCDAEDEFVVEIRDARLKDLNIREPRGCIWGVTATDEQGKINVASAPPRLAASLRTLLSARVVDLKEVLTLYSGRPARWVRPQKIREIGSIAAADPRTPRMRGTRVDNALQMGMGVKVRATKPGLPPFETKVARNGVEDLGIHAVETDPPVPDRYLHGLLEIEMRHPVNVNTARRETLGAIFDGLAITVPTGGRPSTRTRQLTPEEAHQVTEAFYRKNLSTWHDFFQVALKLELDDLAKAAVIINALDPGNLLLHDRREGRGSLGFCFTSNETITVEALAAVNSNAGTPLGGAGFLEVVDLGCPTLLTRSWENQFDFDRMMGPPRLLVSTSGKVPAISKTLAEALTASGLIGTGYAGYPFGSRLETFPRDLEKGEPSDMTLKSGQGKADNYISMRTERDLRGQGDLLYRMEHFDKLLDGLKIDARAYTRPHAEVFAAMPNRADVAAGGTEFWIRFEEELVPSRPVLLFDLRESDETNRISITAQNGQIIYRITDASMGSTGRHLDKGWSEIRAPFVPSDDTWYHIAAYWKGTRHGQMVLMIDGFIPVGAKWRYLDSDGRRAQSTELTSMLGAITQDSEPVVPISLRDTVFTQRPLNWPLDRPWTVPIRIGEEVIEYEPTRNLGRRGARRAELFYGRSAPEHPLGAKATLFGYASPLRNTQVRFDYPGGSIRMDFGPIHATRGAVAHRFGRCRLNTLVGEQRSKSGKVLGQGVQRVNFQILSDANIPTDSSEWPDSGFIRIENEAIYYRKIVRETKKNGFFDQCERGRAGTDDVSHMEGLPIELWSVAVTEPDPKLANPTIVQFNEEWFGPVQLVQVPPGGPVDFYWIGCVLKGQALPFGRGPSLMTSASDHEVGERLVPVFAARERDPSVLRTNMQKYDPVTVIESSNHREQHMICTSVSLEELSVGRYVSQGADVPPPPRHVSERGVQLAAFFAPTTRDFPVDGVHNRVLKWPSGELIGERYLALKNPVVRYGPAPATLDEVKTVASPTSKSEMATIVDATVPELAVNGASAFKLSADRPSGLVLVGEELVGFAVYGYPDRLAYCTRGWLGSRKEVHDRGDAVFPLDFLPVAALNHESLSHASRLLPISQVLPGRGYARGYVFVNDEVVGFEDVGLRGTELDCLARFDGTGLFRGMFGTAASVHPKHSMVFGIPFRYWDGFKPRQFDNRMPYFQAAHTTRNARWRAVRFVAEVDSRDRNLVPNVYLRIDGLGDFPIPAVDDHSAVGRFTATLANPLQDYVSSRLENGQVEARFFLEYKEGSYWPKDSWKRTMKLREVRIDYDRDTKILLHENK